MARGNIRFANGMDSSRISVKDNNKDKVIDIRNEKKQALLNRMKAIQEQA